MKILLFIDIGTIMYVVELFLLSGVVFWIGKLFGYCIYIIDRILVSRGVFVCSFSLGLCIF